jgi:hypothetical protein
VGIVLAPWVTGRRRTARQARTLIMAVGNTRTRPAASGSEKME